MHMDKTTEQEILTVASSLSSLLCTKILYIKNLNPWPCCLRPQSVVNKKKEQQNFLQHVQ